MRGIWRLPPVGNASPFAQPPPETIPTPPVLALPPAETIPPRPDDKPPVSNAPASLSNILSDGERFEVKPDADKLWDGSFNLGLDGSEGNTVASNFQFSVNVTRKTEYSILTANLDYKKQTSNDQTTADRLYFESRLERLIAQSRWSLFVHETIEYDRSQPFNVRDTSDVGVGYRMIKSELTTLIGRLGGGFSHEYGGPEDGEYIPEAVFGLQLECQLGKKQKSSGRWNTPPTSATSSATASAPKRRWRCRSTRRRTWLCGSACWSATIAIRMGPCGTTSITP